MNKPKLYEGQRLSGPWDIYLKIDGVRALKVNGQVLSRAGKPLYNLDACEFNDAEVYFGNWENSVSAVRTHNGVPVPQENVYNLDPPDPRLYVTALSDPEVGILWDMMNSAISSGYEGLVIRQGDVWYKLKPKETFDVMVTGIQMGTGKHLGRVGALITSKGKVGTGFSDAQRTDLLTCVGSIIEVECMGLTPNDKFRHPRFIRVREDLA